MAPFRIICLKWEAMWGYHQEPLSRMRLWTEELAWWVTEKNWGHKRKCSAKLIALTYSCLETILPSHSMRHHHNRWVRCRKCKVTESSKRKCIWINIKGWKRTLFLTGQTYPLHQEWVTSCHLWGLTELYFHKVGISRWGLWDLHMAGSR